MIPTSFLIVVLIQHVVLEYHLLAQTKSTPVPAAPVSDSLNWTTIVLQAVTWLTMVSGFIYTIYRENRNRRWDLEDRAEARKVALEQSQKLEKKVENVDKAAVVVAGEVAQAHRDLSAQIAENTAITVDAQAQSQDAKAKIDDFLERIRKADEHDPNG